MSGKGPDTSTEARVIEPHQRFGIWLLLSLGMLMGLGGLAGLALTGRMVDLPGWATARIEARLNSQFAPAEMRIGGVGVMFSRKAVPSVRFRDVLVLDGAGRDVAALPVIGATISAVGLASGRLDVTHVALDGAELTLRRAPNGRLDLALGRTGAPVSAAASLGELLDEIDRGLSAPGLVAIEAVSVEGLGLTFEDARAGRTWIVENGLMTLDQDADEVAIRAFFSLRGQAELPAELAFDFVSRKGSPAASFAATFSDVPSADIATQSPALAALAVIDAPISGAIRTEVFADGSLGPLTAALEIGAGALRPAGGAPPIGFASGRSAFTYDPEAGRLNFDRITVDTAILRLSAEGHAYLRDMEGGWPETLVAQLAFREVALNPDGVFETPAILSGGALDLQLRLFPFTATLGQVVLLDEGRSYRGRGRVRALPEGWDVAVDATIPEIDRQRLLSLWPLTLAPNTRGWIEANVLAGIVHDGRAALRRPPAGPLRVSLTHAIRDAEVQVLDGFPPIRQGIGHVVIDSDRFALSVERGSVAVPEGVVDVAGSTLKVDDLSADVPRAEIVLRTRSAIAAALSLIDQPPLGITTVAGIAPDLATGEALIETRLDLPLIPDLAVEDVGWQVTGDLRGVGSDALVPGRRFEAGSLRLEASPETVAISGMAALDGVPLRAAWTMPGGPGNGGASRVEGTLELSQATNAAFGIGLPGGSLAGSGRAGFTLDLDPGAAPRFTLDSDLVGLRLAVPELGWSKPAGSAGRLELAGRLGDAPAIDRLLLEAPGLSATGSVALTGEGVLDVARLSRVRLGGWFDAPVVLSGRGAGRPPAVAITGGRVDLRALPSGGGPAGRQGGGAVEVALDRLIVSDGIALTGLRGRLSGQGGLNGQLTGTVEGGGPVVATLVPAEGGTAVRVRSDDAGAALRGVGIYRRAHGGTLDLVLQPEGQEGHYVGQLRIDDLRVRGTPVLAELLSAISVVGLVDLLNREGLMFSNVEARFRLMPGAVELRRASAVGPSLGISMAGVYGTREGRIDMQGVISPVYMLNSIGSVLTRRGEGLFGFNYRLSGAAENPTVRVNPLSILTPGMFREIFRSPPPRARQEAGQ
ncbi:AsmA-like C-terminal region-containing protein [Rhodovulum steppense]|uniref:AsmA-like protein n=1 Tax=Rhodovulum steppense TaxID=540251 RepID=A0A4R1YTI5_9RHOB|nr:AsmA-like C-terminal region-containing protein [Rhodovulum steppense]TCM83395.1 AsmA-like protein [Rhodovulum steppense]